MNKPEVLSFSYQEIYLSRMLIQNKEHLVLYIKLLAKKYNYRADKIIFNHDLEDTEGYKFIDNFKVKGSYEWLKEALK